MKRRDFCKALGLTAAALAMPHAAAAEGTKTVGKAMQDGNHTLYFRSELSLKDLSHDYYYSESFFDHSALEYDHKLALMTLGMVGAAFNTAASDTQYWKNEDVGRQNSIAAAYEELGFAEAEYYHYDIDVGAAGDFVGHSFARKTIVRNGARTTLVAVMLRGGGYGGEWVSNLHTGVGAGHAGFIIAMSEVLTNLEAYVNRLVKEGDLGTVKFWIGGYSRGAIVANLLAGRIQKKYPKLDRNNLFTYTFATPAALTKDSYTDYQTDFDNNHNKDGSLKKTWTSSNIFNLISSGDLVPRVLPKEWGYWRNGNDRFLPSTKNAQELTDLDAIGAGFGPTALVASNLATKEDTDGVLERLELFFSNKQNYHDKYEAVLMDMVQCAFIRSEKEVSKKELLSDAEVEARLRSLGNMNPIDETKLEKSVHNASTMSRALLQRLEESGGDVTVRGKTVHIEIPLRVKQAVIPVLAVGLYYGIDNTVVLAMARYILKFMSMRPDSADVVIRAAFCHHCEDYIALMEYYAPSEHTLEGSTRA